MWSAGKLGAIRVFARYLVAVDPATEVPPVGLLPEPSHRIVPYIYSAEDLAKVLLAADHSTLSTAPTPIEGDQPPRRHRDACGRGGEARP